MTPSKLPLLLRLLGILAAAVAAAGISLEVWCALDRGRAGAIRVTPAAAAHDVLTRPSAAAFTRLARANAASGNMDGAAYAAGVAARLAPDDASLAAAADQAVDAAVRVRVRASARPAASGAVVLLGVLGFAAWRRRREARLVLRTCAGARARLRIEAEGARPAPGDIATVDAATRAVVLDATLPDAFPRLRRPPPVVVTLSSGTADRTVRLSPRTDVRSGAVRWRIEGATLAAIAAAPGRWRVLLRAGPLLLAQAELLVTPTAARRAA